MCVFYREICSTVSFNPSVHYQRFYCIHCATMLGDGGSGGGGEVEKIHPLLREIQNTQTEPPGM